MILTVCDIQAVGSGIWNSWKAELLNQLFDACQKYLQGSKQNLQAKKVSHHLLENFPARYRQEVFSIDELEKYSSFVTEKRQEKLAIHCNPNEKTNIYEMLVYTEDFLGLLATICAVIKIAGGTIIRGKAFVLQNGKALDVIWVKGISSYPIARKKLRDVIMQKEPVPQLEATPELSIIKGQIESQVHFLDDETSDNFSVLEVSTRNDHGILFVLLKALNDENLRPSEIFLDVQGHQITVTIYLSDINRQELDQKRKVKAHKILTNLLNQKIC